MSVSQSREGKPGASSLSGIDSAPAAEQERRLKAIADDHGVSLPPISIQPRWWPSALRLPTGPPVPLPTRPGPLLRTVMKRHWRLLVIGSLISIVNYVSIALIPKALGGLLDAGIDRGLGTHLLGWSLMLVGLIIAAGLASGAVQLAETAAYLAGAFGVGRSVSYRGIERGTALNRRFSTGDVVATVSSDADYVGSFLEFLLISAGSLVSTIVIGVLMLQVSVPLGLGVIIGLVLVAVGAGLIIKPIEARQRQQRQAQGDLTAIATDAVSGLRILRGIGGEDVFSARYREKSQEVRRLGISVAGYQALLHGWQQSLPGVFATIVVAVGAVMIYDGKMTVGDLVAFYAYCMFISAPIWSLTAIIQVGTRTWVGLRKVGDIFSVDPLVSDDAAGGEPAQMSAEEWAGADLLDEETGVRIPAGRVTGLVCDDPDVSAALARRLARLDDQHVVRYAGRPGTQVTVANVRRHVILADSNDELFAGTLRTNLQGKDASVEEPGSVASIIYRDVIEASSRNEHLFTAEPHADGDERLRRALHVADADDIVETLPGGLGGVVSEKGRSLSGGQRQRVALARALATDAPVLICVEPTSAVDSHTEARIAERLAAVRAGRTTVVVSASPLVLERVDQVVVLDNTGREMTRGSHEELLEAARAGERGGAWYRQVIHRSTGFSDEGDQAREEGAE